MDIRRGTGNNSHLQQCLSFKDIVFLVKNMGLLKIYIDRYFIGHVIFLIIFVLDEMLSLYILLNIFTFKG